MDELIERLRQYGAGGYGEWSRAAGEAAAALEAAREAAWQPIETAPKDGRRMILLLTPSMWPQVAFSNTWWTAGFSVENKPTHWIPLPALPREARAGRTAGERT